MKIRNMVLKYVATPAALLLGSAAAMAEGIDYSVVTGAVDGGSIVTAIAAIAAVLVLPIAAKWGFHKVMSMIRG